MKLPACKVSVSSIKKEGRKSELEYTGYSQHGFNIKDNPSLTDPMFLKMMKEQLFEDQRVRVVAESPSGGLKVIFYNGTPIDEKHHTQLFSVGKTKLEKATGLVGYDINEL